MPDDFLSGTDWEGSSGPYLERQVALADLWPEGLNSESDGAGDKDILADGLHPVLAIGGQTAADGRQVGQLTGVVVHYRTTGLVQMNVARGMIVRAYVANVLTYDQRAAATFEIAPVIGQPVYVDDSAALSAGVTLSLAAANSAALVNPLAGWLWYDQDEYLDSGVGGANAAALWPKAWSAAFAEYDVYVLMK